MAHGTVKWFNGDRGYGFIAVEGGQNVFVHVSTITGGGDRSLAAALLRWIHVVITRRVAWDPAIAAGSTLAQRAA